MKEISAYKKMIFFKFLLYFFKLAFQAALNYCIIPRAAFNEYQACGLSFISLALGWDKLAFQAGIALPLFSAFMF